MHKISSLSYRNVLLNSQKLNRYSYVENNPVDLIDPSGLLSYLVSRELGVPFMGSFFSHNFVVTNADYIGDPNATFYSYGENNKGNLGRVDNDTKGFSANTHKDDKSSWVRMDDARSRNENVSFIDAPDSVVDCYANSVKENMDYAAFGEPFGVNSNSAAQAVANRASANETEPPGGSRVSIGADQWGQIEFDTEIDCSAPD